MYAFHAFFNSLYLISDFSFINLGFFLFIACGYIFYLLGCCFWIISPYSLIAPSEFADRKSHHRSPCHSSPPTQLTPCRFQYSAQLSLPYYLSFHYSQWFHYPHSGSLTLPHLCALAFLLPAIFFSAILLSQHRTWHCSLTAVLQNDAVWYLLLIFPFSYI